MVRRYLELLFLLAILVLMPQSMMAAISTTQTVTYEIQAINEIGVSGDPGALIINSATSGGAPVPVSDNTTTYSITTNQPGATITGEIDTDMPLNTTLTINLAAPTGGTSAGAQALSTTAATLATCVAAVSESGLTITYQFSATSAAGVIASAQKTVTLTVVP